MHFGHLAETSGNIFLTLSELDLDAEIRFGQCLNFVRPIQRDTKTLVNCLVDL